MAGGNDDAEKAGRGLLVHLSVSVPPRGSLSMQAERQNDVRRALCRETRVDAESRLWKKSRKPLTYRNCRTDCLR